MKSVESKNFTLRVRTRSSTNNIGTAQTKSINIKVSSTVVPIISNFSVSVIGDGLDASENEFVQHISRAKISFTSTTAGAASVKSQSIQIYNKTDGIKNIFSHSGTSANTGIFNISGYCDVVVTVVDSRNRVVTETQEIYINPYRGVRISEFSVNRIEGTSNANIKYKIYWDAGFGFPLYNEMFYTIDYRKRGESWEKFRDGTYIEMSGVLDTSSLITGLSDTRSYDFRITAWDDFDREGTAEVSVGTKSAPLSIGKHGIGVGKIYEEYNGAVLQLSNQYKENRAAVPMLDFGEGYSIYRDEEGRGSDDSRWWLEVPDGGEVSIGPRAGAYLLDELRFRSKTVRFEGLERMFVGANRFYGIIESSQSGSNRYLKFNDGTMICWLQGTFTASIPDAYGSLYQGTYRWDYPVPFVGSPAVSCSQYKWENSASWGTVSAIYDTYATLRGIDIAPRSNGNTLISAIAIGRWK